MRCENKLEIVSGAGRIINSPKYPEKYPEGLDCKMLIVVETGARAAIQFLRFSVQRAVFYCYDQIDIYDGRNLHAKVLKSRLCGDKFEEKNVIATGNSMLITFQSIKDGTGGVFRFRILTGKDLSYF